MGGWRGNNTEGDHKMFCVFFSLSVFLFLVWWWIPCSLVQPGGFFFFLFFLPASPSLPTCVSAGSRYSHEENEGRWQCNYARTCMSRQLVGAKRHFIVARSARWCNWSEHGLMLCRWQMRLRWAAEEAPWAQDWWCAASLRSLLFFFSSSSSVGATGPVNVFSESMISIIMKVK